MSSSIVSTVRDTFALLRLDSFDLATADGRAAERKRRIAWSSVSAFFAKLAAAIAMLVSVPLTLSYLGTERFGLWMTISSAIAMLGFADLGLGNGILNRVAHASGKDDRREIHRTLSNGTLILGLLGLLIASIFHFIYPFVPWERLLQLESADAAADMGPVTYTLVMCFALGLPLGVTQKVQLGLQSAYWANLWETLGAIAALFVLLLVVQMKGELRLIALAMAGVPVVFRAINTIVFFGCQQPALRPQVTHFDAQTVTRLMRAGSLFFILQVSVIVGFQSDNLIIAKLVDAKSVAVYDVAMKVSTLPAMFIGLVVVAQWPAYGEAMTRGDSAWVRDTFTKTLRTGWLLAVPFAVALTVWGDNVIAFWAGDDVVPSFALLLGMAAWSVLMLTGSIIAALLNGLHVVRFQAINSLLMATANILISIFLVGKLGVIGAIVGTISAYTIFTLLPCWYYIDRHVLQGSGSSAQTGN